MGQRLNIEIVNKDNKVLANAYYHWSGYTSSTLSLVQIVVNSLDDENRKLLNNDILYAIYLLEMTEAGLPDDEVDYYIQNIDNQLTCREWIDRNHGIISVSPKGIEDTRFWEEARVTINIDNELIDFAAMLPYEKDELLEEFKDNEIKISDYEIIKCGFNFSQMTFDDLQDFLSVYEWNKDNIYVDTTDYYYLPIE